MIASVVVTVANSARVLSMTASAYSRGRRRPRRGQHELIATVDRVHDEIRDGDIDRDAHPDNRPDPHVAQNRIEIRARHRPETVGAGQYQIAGLLPELGDQ